MSAPAIAEMVQIPIEKIDDNPEHNCRGKISPADIDNLVKDIAKRGLLQPIIVRELKHLQFDYRIVAGFSRFFSLKLLKYTMIPCVIRKNCNDEEAAFVNLAENLVRNDLNFMQEAESVRKILVQFPHLSLKKVGEGLGKSAGWVQVRLYAINLPEEVKEIIRIGLCSVEQIKAIADMKTKTEQLIAVRKIKEAHERGIKAQIVMPKKRVNYVAKVVRTRPEIFAMMAHIASSLKTHNFGTRCLAWAAGEIDDYELFGDVENIAVNEGIEYTRPNKLVIQDFMEKVRGEGE